MSKVLNKYGKWALVTGASSGIGKGFAQQLAKQGFNLILVARRKEILNELSEELVRNSKVEIIIIAIDLLEDGAVERVYSEVKNKDIGLVIPAAGVGVMGRFIDKDYVSIDRMLKLNILIPTKIIHLFGKKLKNRKTSGIILVSSLFAYQGIPNFSAYAASKSYILALGEALNYELSDYGIDVLVLSPGLTDTPFSQNLEINFSRLPLVSQTPAKVAQIGLKSIGIKPTVVSGFVNKFYAWSNRLIPRSWPVALFGFLIDAAIGSHQKK